MRNVPKTATRPVCEYWEYSTSNLFKSQFSTFWKITHVQAFSRIFNVSMNFGQFHKIWHKFLTFSQSLFKRKICWNLWWKFAQKNHGIFLDKQRNYTFLTLFFQNFIFIFLTIIKLNYSKIGELFFLYFVKTQQTFSVILNMFSV